MSSSQSNSIYGNNSVLDFTVELPKLLELEGEWEVALMKYSLIEVNGKGGQHFYICSDIADIVTAENRLLPGLADHMTSSRKVSRRVEVKCTPVKYSPVRNGQQVSQIRMYIRCMCTDDASVIGVRGEVKCLLHLRSKD